MTVCTSFNLIQLIFLVSIVLCNIQLFLNECISVMKVSIKHKKMTRKALKEKHPDTLVMAVQGQMCLTVIKVMAQSKTS